MTAMIIIGYLVLLIGLSLGIREYRRIDANQKGRLLVASTAGPFRMVIHMTIDPNKEAVPVIE